MSNVTLRINGKNISKDIIKVDLFGHFDILDTDWSNFMHNTLAKGTEDRNSINEYKDFIIHLINLSNLTS